MTLEWDKGPPPAPEDVMAFADGELGPARQEEVAEWLLSRPEAQGQVEDYRRLSRLWQSAAPPEPSPDAWAVVLARIDNEVPHSAPAPAPRRRRATWTFPALAAAAVLGGVLLSRSLLGPRVAPTSRSTPVQQDEEPFTVDIAQAHEINIVGMDARDADALVGHPPLAGALEFAEPADVKLINAEPHGDDGWVPRMGGGDVPMVVAAPPQ
jgi:anti-sigma factor RsiW